MGERLRALRTKKLLTQQVLASRAGVSLNTIHRIETGSFEPRFSTIHKLAAALEIDPAELVGVG